MEDEIVVLGLAEEDSDEEIQIIEEDTIASDSSGSCFLYRASHSLPMVNHRDLFFQIARTHMCTLHIICSLIL